MIEMFKLTEGSRFKYGIIIMLVDIKLAVQEKLTIYWH